jgi:hypothetical protein
MKGVIENFFEALQIVAMTIIDSLILDRVLAVVALFLNTVL